MIETFKSLWFSRKTLKPLEERKFQWNSPLQIATANLQPRKIRSLIANFGIFSSKWTSSIIKDFLLELRWVATWRRTPSRSPLSDHRSQMFAKQRSIPLKSNKQYQWRFVHAVLCLEVMLDNRCLLNCRVSRLERANREERTSKIANWSSSTHFKARRQGSAGSSERWNEFAESLVATMSTSNSKIRKTNCNRLIEFKN